MSDLLALRTTCLGPDLPLADRVRACNQVCRQSKTWIKQDDGEELLGEVVEMLVELLKDARDATKELRRSASITLRSVVKGSEKLKLRLLELGGVQHLVRDLDDPFLQDDVAKALRNLAMPPCTPEVLAAIAECSGFDSLIKVCRGPNLEAHQPALACLNAFAQDSKYARRLVNANCIEWMVPLMASQDMKTVFRAAVLLCSLVLAPGADGTEALERAREADVRGGGGGHGRRRLCFAHVFYYARSLARLLACFALGRTKKVLTLSSLPFLPFLPFPPSRATPSA